MTATPATPLADRFAWMMQWFTKSMAAEAVRRGVDGPLAIFAWGRMNRIAQRFAALVAMWQAGTLPIPRPARPRAAAARAAKPLLLPLLRRKNWFRKLFPETAAPLSGNLYALLQDDAQMLALAAAAPQAGRMLRPMCHMVGLTPPPYLQLPRRPRPARPPKARMPRQLTPEQVDAKVARMSRLAFANLINPEREPMGWRPPNRIGYARPRPWPKRS